MCIKKEKCMEWTIIKSNNDMSVNFIKNYKKGKIEARYVRRCDDYFIVYLSSHSGCNLSCRFCHLTATGQTSFDSVDINTYMEQAKIVLDYYSNKKPTKHVHFNFMSRGEPLENIYFKEGYGPELINNLYVLANGYGLEGSSRISSIFPNTINKELDYYIGIENVIPYYSLYSIDNSFRKRWIPKSLPVKESISLLKEWQNKTGKHVVIHNAFIEGENSSEKNINDICDILIANKLICKMNIVRYNPFDNNKHGTEATEENLEKLKNIFITRMSSEDLLYSNTRIVPRVGFDVKASCGMFV